MSKLTVKAIEKLMRAGSKSLTSDGNGLYFKVGGTDGTSWIFRYKFNKSSTDMGLGGYPSVSLPDARGKASDARKLLANGINPKAARDSERERLSSERRAEDAKRVLFE